MSNLRFLLDELVFKIVRMFVNDPGKRRYRYTRARMSAEEVQNVVSTLNRTKLHRKASPPHSS